MAGVPHFPQLQEYHIRKLLHIFMPSNTENLLPAQSSAATNRRKEVSQVGLFNPRL